jgi:hypothetical protein
VGKVANLVQETSTTAGTGTVTLAAMPGFSRFADRFANGDLVHYVIEDGANWEVGIGTVGASNTLARTTVQETFTSGVLVPSGATAITLSGSGAIVRCAATIQWANLELLLSSATQLSITSSGSQYVARRPAGGSGSLFAGANFTQITWNANFNGTSFVFDGASGQTSAMSLALGLSGALWSASDNSMASFNRANALKLWDFDGRWTSGITRPVAKPAITSGTLTLDLTKATISGFSVSLNANVTTLSILNPPPVDTVFEFDLFLTADGTARTVAWGASVSFGSAGAPTLTSTLNKRDWIRFVSIDGGTSWMAKTMQQAL